MSSSAASGTVHQERYGEVGDVDYFAHHRLAGSRRAERIAHRGADHFLDGGARRLTAWAASTRRSC